MLAIELMLPTQDGEWARPLFYLEQGFNFIRIGVWPRGARLKCCQPVRQGASKGQSNWEPAMHRDQFLDGLF
ncbi:hypothetical protein hamaS1_16990 [Moorella sp. Hama-1]|nr:hypothetical protein hamaS1_16990 [Moorella sp. Hama-1]